MTNLDSILKNFLVTGLPGCGKTTTLLNTIKLLESYAIGIGGCITAELQEKGRRVGFIIKDLASCEEGILAHVSLVSKKRIGRYKINITELKRIGVGSLLNSFSSKIDCVIIDEIGSMEIISHEFQNVVRDLLNSKKIVLGSIHYRSNHKFLVEIRNRYDTEIIEINKMTRDRIPIILRNKVLQLLSH